MGNTREGGLRGAATRIGMTVDEYADRIRRGHKWCTGCKRWHHRIDFGFDSDRTDGRRAVCREWDRKAKQKRKAAI